MDPAIFWLIHTVYPKKYAHGFSFAVLCCGYTLTDFPTSIRLTSLALWQSNDCPSASKATLMNMDKYFIWIHYERLHNHNKAKHNKTVCIFLGIYCIYYLFSLVGFSREVNAVLLQTAIDTKYSYWGSLLENELPILELFCTCVCSFPEWQLMYLDWIPRSVLIRVQLTINHHRFR